MTTTTERNPIFVGLDVETTAGRTARYGNKPIQLGVYCSGHTFTAEMGWREDEFVWDSEAASAHGFTRERVAYDTPRRVERVDKVLYAWLAKRGANADLLIPVGWSVGQYDMPIFRENFPESATLFKWRSVDLNSLCYFLEAVDLGRDVEKPVSYNAWKALAKFHATLGVPGQPRWHDAGYDAKAALLSYQWLIEKVAVF